MLLLKKKKKLGAGARVSKGGGKNYSSGEEKKPSASSREEKGTSSPWADERGSRNSGKMGPCLLERKKRRHTEKSKDCPTQQNQT